MFRYLLMACIALGAFKAKSSHIITSFVEYKIDTSSQTLELEYHLVLDSSGVSVQGNSVLAAGMVALFLNLDTIVPYLGKLGPPNCDGDAYYEAIYRGTINVIPANLGLAMSFEICPPCCSAPNQNIDSAATGCTTLDITTQYDPITGGRFYPPINTIGTHRRIVQNAYAGLLNYNDLGHPYIKGIDSIGFDLTGVPLNSNTFALYEPGFSSITPLPDMSEDSLNGPNVFYPEQAVIRSSAVDSGFTEGVYLVGIKRSLYYRDTLYIQEQSASAINYYYRNEYNSPIDLRISTPDSTFTTNDATSVFTYDLELGDSLTVDITARGPANRMLRLLSSPDFDVLDTNLLSNWQSYAYAELQSLNPSGTFDNQDSSSVRFSFHPTAANVNYMRPTTVFKVVFGTDSCGGDVHSVVIRVRFNKKTRILSGDNDLDSLNLCPNQEIVFSALNAPKPIRWEPAADFTNPTGVRTAIQTMQDGWYYLEKVDGTRLDSIYLSFSPIDSLYGLAQDSINELFRVNDSGQSLEQIWNISNWVNLRTDAEDSLPMIGAGSYSVRSIYNYLDCPNFGDTSALPFSKTWSANYGDGMAINYANLDTAGSNFPMFRMQFTPAVAGMHIQSVFIHGIRDLSPMKNGKVVVRLSTDQGYTKFDTIAPGKKGFIEIPMPVSLYAGQNAQVRIVLDSAMEYHQLYFQSPNYSINNFDYIAHQSRGPNNVWGFADFTFPIGFKYTSTIDLQESQFKPVVQIYPQPTSGLLRVASAELMGQEWTLRALNGTKLAQGTFYSNEAELDISTLPAGIYLLSVDGQVLKVVKE